MSRDKTTDIFEAKQKTGILERETGDWGDSGEATERLGRG